MAKIDVNNKYSVPGKLTARRFISNGEMKVEGIFATHYYFDEIYELESDRFKISNIDVIEERYGSDDYDIVYIFSSEFLDVKYGLTPFKEEDIDKCDNSIYTPNLNYVKGSNLEILDIEKGSDS